ncbi:MAG: endonuclease/exonuclease/phosphatase family protein [Rhodospirillaceae bacterium]|nr:endonuclease/exonuclease/phosphatase family protein [Rhodospirillaceae bacterium]
MLAVAVVAIVGCTHQPHDAAFFADATPVEPAFAPGDLRATGVSRHPASAAAPSGAVQLSVMTYNVHGLPYPLRRDGVQAMVAIAHELRRQQAAGAAPDVVLIQEGFLDSVRAIADVAGYAHVAEGPGPDDTAANDTVSAAGRGVERGLAATARLDKGETLGPLLGSGLHVFSRHPIVAVDRLAFGRHACAGYDCLANKGALLVRLRVPGVADDVQVLTTHLNSRGPSGVSDDRSNAAHGVQVARLAAFLSDKADPRLPLLFGADLNTKRSPPRRDTAARHLADFTPAHISCRAQPQDCALGEGIDAAAHWLDARDLQGYRDGWRVRVEPVAVTAAFDRPVDGKMLSDHVAITAVYRLQGHTRIAVAAPSAF